MQIRRDHERRYYRHTREFYFSLGMDKYTYFRLHLTTPRHRFNFAIRVGQHRSWMEEADRLAAKLRKRVGDV